MYIATFYSYKGGVGRSLALMNVAFDLIVRGKKVLIVDFDLEAPGLETFPLLKCQNNKTGLVDYVHKYLTTGSAPEVGAYVHRCPSNYGEIWIMPAGSRTDEYEYSDRLGDIDWKDLYVNHSGFLLMENLRNQWEVAINPDYVLIDSRTGHTDVGGICTRQLPDSVVFLFFPNEQNLYGIERIVRNIREQSSRRTKQLIFALSNVPDLDDEDRVLEKLTERSRALLGYDKLDVTIHHYDSLSLLNQEIFVVSRARTKLAAEYKALARAIVKHNHEDRIGVLEYLREVITSEDLDRTDELQDKLLRLQEIYKDDAEVLRSTSRVYERLGDSRAALDLARRSLTLRTGNADDLLRIAFLTRSVDGRQAAVDAFLGVWNSPDVQAWQLHAAILQLRTVAPDKLKEIVASDAYRRISLREKRTLLSALLWERCEDAAESVAHDILKAVGVETSNEDMLSVVLFLIGAKRYEEALTLISNSKHFSKIEPLFNSAMAVWGRDAQPPLEMFHNVIDMHDAQPSNRQDGANYWQCIAISAKIIGKTELAQAAISLAREKVAVVQSAFSAWRYREVLSKEFLSDLSEISESMPLVPRLIKRQSNSA